MSIQGVALLIADLLLGPDLEADYRIESKSGQLYFRITFGEVTLFAVLPPSSGLDIGESEAVSETALRQQAGTAALRVVAMNGWIADPQFKVRKVFATRGQHSMTLTPRRDGSGNESSVELTFTTSFGTETAVHEMGHAVLWPHEQSQSKLWRAIDCIYSKLGQTERVDFTVNGTPGRPRPVGYLLFDPVRWQPEANRVEHGHDDASELWASAFEAHNFSRERLLDSLARAKQEDPAVSPAGDDLIAILQTMDPSRGNGAGLEALLDTVLARPGCLGSLSVVAPPEVVSLGTLDHPSTYRYLLNPELLLRDGGRRRQVTK